MEKKKANTKKKASDANSTTSFCNVDLQKICFDYSFDTTVICNILSAEVTAGQPWLTYFSYKPTEDEECINIYIAYENFDRKGNIKSLYIKNENVSLKFLQILFNFLLKNDTISTVRLEYCNLNYESIEFLQKILRDCPQITDIYLDGNPNSRQNFGCILEGTDLKFLSLKRCKINENGLKLICENLNTSTTLIALNLTGNYIDDNAVIHLANMLRQNRSLRNINLTDNWITDKGCCEIMKPLKNFILTHEEIVIKRKINFDYYTERLKMIKQYIQERDSNSDETGYDHGKNVAVLTSLDLKTIYESLEKFRISKNSSKDSFSDSTSSDERQLIFYIDENCTPPIHPFVNNIIQKDKQIRCTGNFHLTSLNLAYNKLSSVGYKFIIDALDYQLSNNIFGLGLTFIDLDGNADQSSSEFFEIYKLLMEKRLKLGKTSKSSISRRSKNSI